MDNSSHNSFEDQWRDAFDDASMTPSDWVWDGIEASLEQPVATSSTPDASGGASGGAWGIYSAGIALMVLVGAWFLKPEDDSVKEMPVLPIIQHQTITRPEVTHDKPSVENKVKFEKSTISNKSEEHEEELTVTPPSMAEESIIKSVVDSISFISPTTTKEIPVLHNELQVNHAVTQPTIPVIPTPYFEPQQPAPIKPQRKPFLKNVKISVGAGVYQRP